MVRFGLTIVRQYWPSVISYLFGAHLEDFPRSLVDSSVYENQVEHLTLLLQKLKRVTFKSVEKQDTTKTRYCKVSISYSASLLEVENDSSLQNVESYYQLLKRQGVDEPLSATGFRQADAAGLFLSNVKFTHVFSSDLLRAKQTAATILGKNKFCKDLEIKCDARLRERKYGVAEGRPLADLKAMAKAAGEQCPSFTPSGGETLDEVKERARDFFEFLCQLAVELEQKEQDVHGAAGRSSGTSEEQFVFPWTNHCSEAELSCGNGGVSKILDANILVVSHGAYMRNWIGYFVSHLNCTLPSDLTKSQLSSVSPNTGVSHFVIKLENGNLLKPEITCVCLNQDSHLVDVGAERVAQKVF